jgi:hypothetical protein
MKINIVDFARLRSLYILEITKDKSFSQSNRIYSFCIFKLIFAN